MGQKNVPMLSLAIRQTGHERKELTMTMLQKPVIKDLHEGHWLSREKEVLCNRYYDVSRSFANLKNTNLTEFRFLGKSKTSPKSKTCSFGQKP